MFRDRVEAGQKLAVKLLTDIKIFRPEADQPLAEDIEKLRIKFVVLGIPRGGVVVAKEVADKIGCLLDVIVTKKLRAPMQSELAIGAVGETKGSLYTNDQLIRELEIGGKYLGEEIRDRQKEIKRREKLYREGRQALDLRGKAVLIVDDGAATGATIIAAAREARERKPKKVIIGLPVVAKDTLKKLGKEADAVVVLDSPLMFYAVGQFYQDFPQTSDDEVVEILSKNQK